ncbi:hypothetical protein RJ640_019285 [Escallonia rubra]|uniref:DYW domain-containing protein n=1 Tax=Escallonia rubra TaxID=112253 RepID=A0AA88UPV8_9ASTE|nr:hypothetical protein RJ640_019285 [Escallonia rubra]
MSHLTTIAQKVTSSSHLRQLHAQVILNSLHGRGYWAALLISHCTRLQAPPPYARLVFDSAHQPNVLLFTSMLKFYTNLDAHGDVINLFDEMMKCGVKPDAFVYPIVVKSAGKAGVALHGHVMKAGHACDRYVRNAIMCMYAKYGHTEVARKLFDEMSDRNLEDWNSMISGYWNCGNEIEALRLFDSMPEKNVITWTAMVSGYSKMKNLESARLYFNRVPEKSVVTWNAMLSGYAQNGFAEEAISLFSEMLSAGVHPDKTTWVAVISSCSSRGDPCVAESLLKLLDEKCIRLNVFVQTALLDMYAKCGNLAVARNFFDELGVRRNSVTWNAMISAYTRVGDLTTARNLFDRMPEKDVVSWNSMIAGYAQNGQSVLAIELFKEMAISKDSKPDEVTMVSALSACGHLGALESGKWVVNFLTRNQITLSISGYNSLIFMYSKCGSMKLARKVFQEMKTRDVVAYNTMITGLAAHGLGIEAFELVHMMKEEGILPDSITHNGLLTACSHAGLLEEGQKVFESIRSPDTNHYACMVDLLGRAGKLDEAKRLIEKMPMQPHAGVYGSLLNASRVHRRVDLGELAANKLFELEPENPGSYVLLSNLYASTGKWKDVERIREEMKKRGVKKTIGWSWVEHNGKVHKFRVGDRSHEQSKGIYGVLAELKKRMRIAGFVDDKSCVLRDVEEEEKEEMVGTHSEKLAIAFALLVSETGTVIRVLKNLRICWDCHTAIKMISKLEGREIIVRDNNRFHCFRNGLCSCKDYW